MTGILDYGMGNLRSVQKAIECVGGSASIVKRPDQLGKVDRLILPGVGAFADAMANLRDASLVQPLKQFIQTGRPFLGICLGLQLLFQRSEENGDHQGLGVLRGRVLKFRPPDRALKVPHMGWNNLHLTKPACALFHGLPAEPHVYFVHSYHAVPQDPDIVAATSDYAGDFCAALQVDNIFACQFHPEKSQRIGLTMLRNFTAL